MSRALQSNQQKLAEKLTILNDRGIGMLTRIYNIKKACADPKSRPSFLALKTLEPAIKYIGKKFPNIDVKGVPAVQQFRPEILKSMSLYYYTFVDLLDFKDNVQELLTIMDVCSINLNIAVNFDLTKAYLDLVSTYVSLMLILSRVEDRKAVLGLFNVAHEMTNNHGDASFPRLGQMVQDFDTPLKKLSEEFFTHTKLLLQALTSLREVFPKRNFTADLARNMMLFSLLNNPANMLQPADRELTPCCYTECLSIETVERWIIVGFVLCHQSISQQQQLLNELWFPALQNGWVLTLFRDEVWPFHTEIMSFFEGIKGYNKRVSEVKECYNNAIQNAARVHREKRKFLRVALKEISLVITDQPGLLGPKALTIFSALSMARDEFNWLVRHGENPPPKAAGGKKGNIIDDLVDRQLPELLFHIEELRALVRKYSQILQRYYVQFLAENDAVSLQIVMQHLNQCSEDDSAILTSIYDTICGLNVKQVADGELFDLRSVRLDWFRLQSYSSTSVSSARSFQLMDHSNLALTLNDIMFRSKLVDYLDGLLVEFSDLSQYAYYSRLFEDNFHMCLEFPAQNRYIIAFPLICAHFQNSTHELCPEERHHIRERSLSLVNLFLDEMAKEAKNITTAICDEQCNLSDKLRPKHCARFIAAHQGKKKGSAANSSKSSLSGKKSDAISGHGSVTKPGSESYRKTREVLTTMDKLHMALTELCFSINYCPSICVWEYTFAPREYLYQHLEMRFAKALVGMVSYNPDTMEIAKPSEFLDSVRSYMNVLQFVENYVHLDMSRVFNNVLLQQTQNQDPLGEKTIAQLYCHYYSSVLLNRVKNSGPGHIVFSPSQRAFVSLTAQGAQPFNVEEFSDVNELRALADLIGPYGMKLLNETLVWDVAREIMELKKIVVLNKDILQDLRTNFDKPEKMKELTKRLTNVDHLLGKMICVGITLSVYDIKKDRENFPDLGLTEGSPTSCSIIDDMGSAAGIKCRIDPMLVQALRSAFGQSVQAGKLPDGGGPVATTPEDDYLLSCLLMVFIAVTIPQLARQPGSTYRLVSTNLEPSCVCEDGHYSHRRQDVLQ
ncbi:unnamed protein product [Notodromas monacha]|uniref:Membrane-associated protein Hem n=1 Tax=Notodromas monacha TaxID=399045 RepID=A0A7R9BIZ8_9CRUS|nr:unnamed protein product [Notodromas monacha]CAG0916090.1 unnamed protein product [Notodromas monacha]